MAVALLVFTTATGCNEDSPTSPGQGAPVIVAFGDSLTSGPGLQPGETYPALLQRRIAGEGREYRVVNAGVTGDTSTEALRRFDAALVPGAKIVILAIGANDGLRGVLVPFFLLGIVGNGEWDLDDTLHPNAAGRRAIADTIWPHLRPML